MKRKHKEMLAFLQREVATLRKADGYLSERHAKLHNRVTDLEIRFDELQPKFPHPTDGELLAEMRAAIAQERRKQ